MAQPKKPPTREEVEARWREAQSDIPRHDAEFKEANPDWDEKHGGGKR
jgi:hypothetical protein